MAKSSILGDKIFIGPVSVAATTSALAALSYTQIKGVEAIPEFGNSSEIAKFVDTEGNTFKFKGPNDAGDLEIVVAYDPLDAGQVALLAASQPGVTDTYAIKVLCADGADSNDTDTAFYFLAIISGSKNKGGTASDVRKRGFTMGISGKVFEVVSTVVA